MRAIKAKESGFSRCYLTVP